MHEPGLRERKRLATRRAIQVAVLELSLQHGFERVTVEEIGRHAQVSPRTFFNYFASKEEAVLGGVGDFAPTDEQRDSFVQGDGDLIDDLIALLSLTVKGVDDLPLHRLRRRLMEREPGLVSRHIAGAQAFEMQISALIAERLHALRAEQTDGSSDEQADAQTDEAAQLLTLVAFAVVRFGWGKWVAADGRTSMAESLQEAQSMFREVCGTGGTRSRARRKALVGAAR